MITARTTASPWPWVCESCGSRYSAFRVYARSGWLRLEWTVCAACGPAVPGWVEPPRAGWQDVYHAVLRPVPEAFDPLTNPYPSDPRPALVPPPVYEKYPEPFEELELV